MVDVELRRNQKTYVKQRMQSLEQKMKKNENAAMDETTVTPEME